MIKDTVRLIRIFNHMNIVELGKALGISFHDVADMESGITKVSDEILVKYALIFGINYQDIRVFSEDLLPDESESSLNARMWITGSILRFLDWIDKSKNVKSQY